MKGSTSLGAGTVIQAGTKNEVLTTRKNKRKGPIMKAVQIPIKVSILPPLKAKNVTRAKTIMAAKAVKRAIQVLAKVAGIARARAQRMVKGVQVVELRIVIAQGAVVKSTTKAEARNAIVAQAAATNITITRVAVNTRAVH